MTILVCKTNSLCCGSQHQACILHVQKQNAKMKDKNKSVIEEVNISNNYKISAPARTLVIVL